MSSRFGSIFFASLFLLATTSVLSAAISEKSDITIVGKSGTITVTKKKPDPLTILRFGKYTSTTTAPKKNETPESKTTVVHKEESSPKKKKEKVVKKSPVVQKKKLAVKSKKYNTIKYILPKDKLKLAIKKINGVFFGNSPKKEKTLFFTFDDGPTKGTANVLKILKEEGVEATMFFIGQQVQKHKELFQKALAMPNLLVANHTYSHANGRYSHFYSNTKRVINDVIKAQKIIGGEGAKILRLAGRNVWRLPLVTCNDNAIKRIRRISEATKYDALRKNGYQIFGWDAEWRYNQLSGKPLLGPEKMAARIEAQAIRGKSAQKGKVVLLLHDFMFKGRKSTSAKNLKKFIRLLKAKNWKFATLYDYIATPQQILVRKQRINIKNLKLVMQLNDALLRNNTQKVKELILQGANLNIADTQGRLPLNTAVLVNNLSLVKELIRNGAKVANADKKGETPIALATLYHRDVIKTYLKQESAKHSIALSQKRLQLKIL